VSNGPRLAESLRAFALAVPLLWAGCAGADARAKPLNRTSQVPMITEEVLRYQVRQFSPKDEVPPSEMCVAFREGGTLTDPDPAILQRLNNSRVRPRSNCNAAQTLVAGPIEWLRDDEVLVKGAYIRHTQGEMRLVYRVVHENGHWVCVGPVLSSDPL
jgi:hypothetical protein